MHRRGAEILSRKVYFVTPSYIYIWQSPSMSEVLCVHVRITSLDSLKWYLDSTTKMQAFAQLYGCSSCMHTQRGQNWRIQLSPRTFMLQ